MNNEEFYTMLQSRVNMGVNFSVHSGIVITKVEQGYAEGEHIITDTSLNPMGGLHGGLLSTLADTVSGAAAITSGKSCVTLSNTINYLRQTKGGKVRCESSVRKHGKNVTFVEALIYDGEGSLVATGSFSFFMTGVIFEPEKL